MELISHWMFSQALAFNQDIGNWDVSNGTDFSYMFYRANVFNQDIRSWDVSNGTAISLRRSTELTLMQSRFKILGC